MFDDVEVLFAVAAVGVPEQGQREDLNCQGGYRDDVVGCDDDGERVDDGSLLLFGVMFL